MKKFFYAILFTVILLTLVGAKLPKDAPPLHIAIESGNLKTVTKLVEEGADLNERYQYRYPLERSVSNRNITLYLLSKGAKDGAENALREIMNKQNYAYAKEFIAAGELNPNVLSASLYSLFSNKNLTFQQKIETVKQISDNKFNNPIILKYGSLRYADSENYQTLVDAFNLKLSDKINNLGQTILHDAVQNIDADLVKYLLSQKVNINAVDNNDHNALFYAITAFGPSIDWQSPIIENDTEARIKFNGGEPFYSNPRELQQQQVGIVMALLQAKINVNQQNYAGWTVLHFASARYPEGLQTLLIDNGVNKNLKTKFGRTAEDVLKLRR
jgi:ankyrin repeat protein